jgi:hypothetical protein
MRIFTHNLSQRLLSGDGRARGAARSEGRAADARTRPLRFDLSADQDDLFF